MFFKAFRFKKFDTKVPRLYRVVPRAGKNIQVHAFFVFRKMRGDGTGFNELHERESGRERIFMTEVRNECFAVPFHVNDVIT